MIKLPEGHKTFTLLAIDPGLNNTGIAIFTVQLDPFKILSITATTLKAERLIDDSGLDDEDFIERLHKRYCMGNALRNILESTNPCIVASESPFFDRRKPGSFAVLTEVLTTLFDTVVQYNPLIRFSMIPPLSVKMVLGVAGQKGKEVVRTAMETTQPIMDALKDELNLLDEHAVDAIGVGYTYLIKRSGLVPETKGK